ncbi:hypothetical protein [Dactylosporangium sp. NPDC005555]|uniref:hypothetical protein n=1 Tax=Dactylosporangium sp. NPDC005555 TaxID=3154889 RepID=UPI00339EC752
MDAVSRVPPHWRYALLVFAVARVVLSLLGVLVRRALEGAGAGPPEAERQMLQDQAAVSEHVWYSMWFAWDAFQYHNLAELPWLSWAHTGFPLLYPVLGKAVATVTGGDTPLAMTLVSSAAYVVLLSYVYRWTLVIGKDPEDHGTARRACRFLALMPAAFLFQAPLTESLFLCLTVAAFYHAERGQWLLASGIGYFAAMSRSVGFLIVIPLAMLALRDRKPRSLALLLVPAGWLTFMAYSYWKVGDWFDYQNEQRRGWQIEPQNPLHTVWQTLNDVEAPLIDRTRLWIALAVVALTLVGVAGPWRLHPAYAVYTVLLVLASMTIGEVVYRSLLRYLLIAFPLAVLLARWTARREAETAVAPALACAQGVLFALWIMYWTHTII